MKIKQVVSRLFIAALGASTLATGAAQSVSAAPSGPVKRVLLISVDGLHSSDLSSYIAANPKSTLAALAGMGVWYPNASGNKPTDSFAGLMGIVTGGTPKATGIYYDDSYDRKLSPPGSNCSTIGTEVLYDGSIDADPTRIDGGVGYDQSQLPRNPYNGCQVVYPHQYLRVNTIFEVAKAYGFTTAWADKHLSYEIVRGPSGGGVNDLFTPEIDSANGTTNSITKTQAYDDLKVQAVLRWIKGWDHTGAYKMTAPAIFGMNFQAVSVGQKLKGNGYTDAAGTPSKGLASSLAFVDQSLGKMVTTLKQWNQFDSTLIIITAKHGQSPIDPTQRRIIDSNVIPGIVDGVKKGLLAQATQDDVALQWLTDSSKTQDVVNALRANAANAGVADILYGDSLKAQFGDPTVDSRVPDIIVQPQIGVIYTSPKGTKLAEHGGFSQNDANVALLIANPGLKAGVNTASVQTTQIAPTILQSLGMDPNWLQAVKLEKTAALPGLAMK